MRGTKRGFIRGAVPGRVGFWVACRAQCDKIHPLQIMENKQMLFFSLSAWRAQRNASDASKSAPQTDAVNGSQSTDPVSECSRLLRPGVSSGYGATTETGC